MGWGDYHGVLSLGFANVLIPSHSNTGGLPKGRKKHPAEIGGKKGEEKPGRRIPTITANQVLWGRNYEKKNNRRKGGGQERCILLRYARAQRKMRRQKKAAVGENGRTTAIEKSTMGELVTVRSSAPGNGKKRAQKRDPPISRSNKTIYRNKLTWPEKKGFWGPLTGGGQQMKKLGSRAGG